MEYTTLVLDLLRTSGPVTRAGKYYTVTNLKMTPPLPPELFPGVFVSGSSAAGLEAARTLGATAVQYPKPASEYASNPVTDLDAGIRVGIVAREDSAEAWRIARQRFPEDRKGQITHQLAMKVSDSSWHKQLSDLGELEQGEENPYWLVPFENYKTFCPYLVGSYERVADELSRYMTAGYRTFIIDVPASPEELEHIRIAFDHAGARVAT
jgi:alkanesulfonate monooxygenase